MKSNKLSNLRGGRTTRGSAIVEFVLVSGLLIFLLFGIMEMGFMFSSSLTVASAAHQGARAAALSGNSKDPVKSIETAVYNAARTLPEPRDFTFGSGTVAEYAPEGSQDWQPWTPGTAPSLDSRDQVRVTVTYPYKYITGDLLGGLGNLLSGKSGQPTDHRNLVGVAVMRYGG
jgi:Flp pilus assembly protein TadG